MKIIHIPEWIFYFSMIQCWVLSKRMPHFTNAHLLKPSLVLLGKLYAIDKSIPLHLPPPAWFQSKDSPSRFPTPLGTLGSLTSNQVAVAVNVCYWLFFSCFQEGKKKLLTINFIFRFIHPNNIKFHLTCALWLTIILELWIFVFLT